MTAQRRSGTPTATPSASQRWTLTIRFDSDWHCGTGQGQAGGVDRTVSRDRDGLPHVPAKHLKGMWRDGCERAAYGLDDGTRGGWTVLVERLFGPGPAAGRAPEDASGRVVVGDANLPPDWREALRAIPGRSPRLRTMLRDGLTLTRFGVAIDGSTRTARDDMLREVEVARAGLAVTADCELPAPLPWQAELVLLAGLQLLDHLGAKRRRGLGRCVVTVDDANALTTLIRKYGQEIESFRVEDARALLPTAGEGRSERPGDEGAVPGGDDSAAGQSGRWSRRATVRLLTRQPLLATRTVLGNTVLGHEFVPGATLLPLVAPALGAEAARLLREGRVVVTDANPVIDGRRASRTPLTVASADKGRAWQDEGNALDLIRPPDEVPTGVKPIGGWSAPVDRGFWWQGSTSVSRAHAVIEDVDQRTGEEGMFVYQAISAGTPLEFEIWDDGCLDNTWAGQTRLPGQAAIGRSRLSGYGAVDVTVEGVDPVVDETPGDETLKEFVLTLGSDAVIVDDTGLPDPTAAGLTRWLQDELNRGSSSAPVTLAVHSTRVTVVRRDSWHGALSAPKTTVVALQAGSVVRVIADPAVSRDRLQGVIDAGVGSLHVEGFGRARLQAVDKVISKPKVTRPRASFVGPAAGSTPLPADEAWRVMVRQVWRDEIHRRVVDAAGGTTLRESLIAPSVSLSQLGSLREAARGGASAVCRWVASARARKSSLDAWGKARLDRIEGLAGGGPPPPAESEAALPKWLNEQIRVSNLAVPDDLGGNDTDEVLAIIVGELTRRQMLVTQKEAAVADEGAVEVGATSGGEH